MFPLNPAAHVDVGTGYVLIGQPEQAITPLNECIRLRASFAAVHHWKSRALLRLNRFVEAKDALTQALQLKLELTQFHTLLYQLAFIDADATGMQQQTAWSSGKPDEYVALDWQTAAAAFAGQWRKSQEFSRRSIDLSTRGENREVAARYATEQALRSAVLGDFRAAKASVAEGLALGRGRLPLARASLALALCGETSRAKTIADELSRRFPEDTLSNEVWLPSIRAAIDLQPGSSATGATRAIEQLQATSRYEAVAEFWPLYLRGQAYLSLKKGGEAMAEFQRIIDHRGHAPLSLLYPLAHLGIARAAELSGDTERSRKAHADFLSIWKDADAGLPMTSLR